MRYGNFSVLVNEGREHGSGHVGLAHGQQYTLRLGNHGNQRCDARVEIDGKDMGTYRLGAYQSWNLERVSHDSGRFTFFQADSPEAATAGVGEVANEQRGLIQVTFRPERVRRYDPCVETRGALGAMPHNSGTPRSFDPGTIQMDCCFDRSEKTSAGITGLTGHSGQQFVTVASLDYDPTGEVVITLRLMQDARVDAVRKLEPARGNPTPAPVQ